MPVVVVVVAGVNVARPCVTQVDETATLTGVPAAPADKATVNVVWP